MTYDKADLELISESMDEAEILSSPDEMNWINALVQGLRKMAEIKVYNAKHQNARFPRSGDQSSMDAAILRRFADELEGK